MQVNPSNLIRLVIILIVILVVACNSSESNNPGDTIVSEDVSEEKSPDAIFTSRIGLADASQAKELFSRIDSLTSTEKQSEDARRKEVTEKYGDTLKLGEKATDGAWKGEEAVKLVSVLEGDGSHEKKIESAREGLEKVLHDALSHLTNTGITRYEAAKRLHGALSETWPGRRFTLPPARRLEGLPTSPAKPVIEDKYRALMTPVSDYYYSETYRELDGYDKGLVPAAAVPALFRLKDMYIPTGVLRDEGISQPSEILSNLSPDACEAVISCLVYPEECGTEFKEPPYRYLTPLSHCPEERRREVFEATLESGWISVENYLPGIDPWADEILDKYNDSPFGRPIRAPQRRPLSSADNQLLEQKLEEYKQKFTAQHTGNKSADTDLYYKLKKEISIEKKNVRDTFDTKAFEWTLVQRKN